MTGFAFALITSVLFAASNVYMRQAGTTVDGRVAMTAILTVNALFLVPPMAILLATDAVPAPDLPAIAAFVAVGIVGGWLGRWGLYVAIRELGAGRASAVKNSSPMFALLLGVVVLRQLPGFMPSIGILLILSGVWALGRGQRIGLVQNPVPIGPQRASQPHPAVVNVRRLAAGGGSAFGLVMAIGVAFLFALADVIRSIGMDRYPNALVGAGMASIAAWIGSLVLNEFMRRGGSDYVSPWSRPSRAVLVVAVVTGMAQITNFLAVRFMLVAYVSALLALTPLFTAVLGGILSRGLDSYDRRFYFNAGLLVGGAALIGIYA